MPSINLALLTCFFFLSTHTIQWNVSRCVSLFQILRINFFIGYCDASGRFGASPVCFLHRVPQWRAIQTVECVAPRILICRVHLPPCRSMTARCDFQMLLLSQNRILVIKDVQWTLISNETFKNIFKK